MKIAGPWLVLTLLTAAAPVASPAWADSVETIVMVRHGEKPAAGLGQLTCQGLNRALGLPRVIEAKFGKPDFIFAPDPAQQKDDRGTEYDYVRPLATIEPSAVFFGMPVNTSIGYSKAGDLRRALLQPQYKDSTILVGWEHTIIEKLARRVMSDNGGDAASVPRWPSDDFDSIYVLRITRSGDTTHAAFVQDHEGLDNQPVDCPAGK